MRNSALPDGRRRDLRASFVCAEAFQKLAEQFIPRIAVDVKEGTHAPSAELGQLVASAVNLAFALELYLKTLLGQLQLRVPQHHNLRNLYDTLPQEVRDEIEKAYDEHWRSQWLGKHAAITVAKGPSDKPKWNDRRNESKDLAALLERSGNVFQTWRYIYEFTEPEDGAYQFHQFEYGLLLCACQSLRTVILERLPDPADIV